MRRGSLRTTTTDLHQPRSRSLEIERPAGCDAVTDAPLWPTAQTFDGRVPITGIMTALKKCGCAAGFSTMLRTA